MAEGVWPPVGSVPVYPRGRKPRRGRAARWVAVGVVVALLLATGGFVAMRHVVRELVGAPTPEAAVTRLLDAYVANDGRRLAAVLSPAELRPLLPLYSDLADLADLTDADAPTPDPTGSAAVRKAIDSFHVTVKGLELADTQLDDGLAKVSITAGTLTVDGDSQAFKDWFAAARSRIAGSGPFAQGADAATELYDDLADHLPHTVDLPHDLAFQGGDPFLVTVQEGGRWYVSPLMTLGEYAAASAGVERGPMPDPDNPVRPADPVAAAQQFAQALESVPSGDLAPLASVLPLAERRFVSVYGQALVDDATVRTATSGVSVRVTSTGFEVAGRDGASAQVVPLALAFDVTDSAGTTHYSTNGECLDSEGPKGQSHDCTTELPLLGTLGLSQLRIATVEEDGGWYVSVLGTVASEVGVVVTSVARLAADGSFADPEWWLAQLGATVPT